MSKKRDIHGEAQAFFMKNSLLPISEILIRYHQEQVKPFLDLLEEAHGLIGHPATNISGSIDLACEELRRRIAKALEQ